MAKKRRMTLDDLFRINMPGCEVEFVRFEGASHGLSRGGRPQYGRERLRRIGERFDRKMT